MGINNEEDKGKVEQIWSKYHGLMLYIAKGILTNPVVVEDAVSEAYIKIIHNLNKLDDISSYQTKSYIVSIVRSVSIDILRKNKDRVEYFDEALSETPNNDTDILNNIVIEEGVAVIKDAIKLLPPHLKDVVYLYLVHGYSHNEIAKMLNITEAASKMRLYRAKSEIRKRLVGENHEK